MILSFTFSNLFTEENNALILTRLNIFHEPDKEKLDTTEILVREVRKHLPKINPSKSTGSNEVLPLIL